MPTTDHDLSSMLFATTARVAARATEPALLDLAIARGVDPSVFDSNPPFFWSNEISSNRLDAYFTRMDPLTTLPNFAADAARGVAFLAGHDTRGLPFGSTLTGTVETLGDVTRVLADAYTLSGLDLGGINTDSFIKGVRAGIIKDDSVQFYGGQWICDICGRDMLADWYDCWHVPGLVHEVTDASGAQTMKREQLCTALVKNAHLAEVSAVYDGATPGAAILQAQRAAESGRLTQRQAQLLEQRYRINLPGKRVLVTGADLPKEHQPVEEETQTPAAEPMPAAETPDVETSAVESTPAVEVPAVEPAAEAPVTEQRSAPAGDPFAGLRSVLGVDASVDVAAHVRQLVGEATDGRAYRTSLIDAALVEGARAIEGFNPEVYRGMLGAASIDAVKQLTADWTRMAGQRFGGGRKTADPVAPVTPETPAPVVKVPNAAYSG